MTPPEARGTVAWWVAAALLIVAGALLMHASTDDLRRSSLVVDGTPVRVLEPTGPPVAPTVVLAHGFSGSAAMTDPLGSALARAGHLVVMPDLPGHGSNADPLVDGSLEPAIATAVGYAAERTGQPVAVVGHSMGAAAVTRWAVGNAPAATVALSLPSADDLPADPAEPRNLLLLWGAAEQARFVDAAQEGLRRAYPDAVPGPTYGSFADGTARRADEVAGAEHIAILYRAETAREVADWLAQAVPGDGGEPSGDRRLLGLLLVLAGGVVATRPLAGALVGDPPPAETRPLATTGWLAVGILGAAAGASVAAGLAESVPVAVAGYLTAWFAAGAVVLTLASWRRRAPLGTVRELARGLAAGAILAACLALPARLAWAGFSLAGPRPIVLVVLLFALGAWFWGEARLLAGTAGWRRGVLLAVSRLLVVAGLLAAVVLLGAPGFLTLTVPLMVPILALLGVVAWWTRDPAAAAAVAALPLSLVIATTFPIVG